MQRLAMALLSSLAGCLATALEDAPCNSSADCLGGDACIRTLTEATAGAPGRCRHDGACARGQQDGCAVSAFGTCDEEDLEDVCDPETDACFCCDLSDAYGEVISVGVGAVAEDGSSANCVVCFEEDCEWWLEPCLARFERCIVEDDDDPCGCRVPESEVENSPCADGEVCGSDFTCERTLEQLEEAMEPLVEDQMQEWGACRPEGEPQCEPGQQNGCRVDPTSDGCADGLLDICSTADSRCFCCASQSDAPGFALLVYTIAADGSSAACTMCPTDCESGNACTAVSHADCILEDGGPCGCTTP